MVKIEPFQSEITEVVTDFARCLWPYGWGLCRGVSYCLSYSSTKSRV